MVPETRRILFIIKEKQTLMSDKKLFAIALNLIPGIGPKRARTLVSYLGSVEKIFTASKKELLEIPGIGQLLAKNITSEILEKAQKELDFCKKNNIKTYFYLDDDYPSNLKNFEDSPVILYVKGNANFDIRKKLAVVGTRGITHYGDSNCKQLIKQLAEKGFTPLIISGLAHGIDTCAHKAALENDLPTIAVLGHGLNMIYPASNRELAKKIIENGGGLVTEFNTTDKPEAKNFVRRNRIIAALSNAVIVVESPKKGGSLITAEYAVGYSKEIFTFPGRVGDTHSEGCNYLIKTNRASLIENASDLIYQLSWTAKPKVRQKEILPVLTNDEQKIVEILKNVDIMNVDTISFETGLPINKVLSLLFELEFKDVVKALPGRMYKLI